MDRNTMSTVYYGYVYSILNYAVTTWGNGAEVKCVLPKSPRKTVDKNVFWKT